MAGCQHRVHRQRLYCPNRAGSHRPRLWPPEYGTPAHFRRLFNPVGGFQSVVLTLPAEREFTVMLKMGDGE